MAVREFLSTEAGWKAEGSFEAILNGPHTFVALMKPLDFNVSGTFWAAATGGTNASISLADGGSARLAYFTATEDVRVVVNETEDEWQILGWSKATGTVAPRGHRKKLGAGGWTHANGAGTITDKTDALDRFSVGSFANMRIAVLAIFNTELSDVDFEALDAIATSQLLVDLGALHLWNFNQASTATAVQDLIGTAHQTSITSGSIAVTGDDPPGWDFNVTVIPPLTFAVKLSGGTGNTSPGASIGGAISTTAPGTDLFDDVSNPERTAGITDYRLVYVLNNDTDAGSVIAYVPTQLESGRQLAVGVATEAAGVPVSAIANDQTAPAGVSFSTGATVPAGVSLGTIPAGSYRGLWLRRTVNAATAQDPTNLATVKLEVSRVA